MCYPKGIDLYLSTLSIKKVISNLCFVKDWDSLIEFMIKNFYCDESECINVSKVFNYSGGKYDDGEEVNKDYISTAIFKIIWVLSSSGHKNIYYPEFEIKGDMAKKFGWSNSEIENMLNALHDGLAILTHGDYYRERENGYSGLIKNLGNYEREYYCYWSYRAGKIRWRSNKFHEYNLLNVAMGV